MAAVTVGCHTNNPPGRCHCWLSYKRSVKNMFICCKNMFFFVFFKTTYICMTNDSDGCHLDYFYDNRQ